MSLNIFDKLTNNKVNKFDELIQILLKKYFSDILRQSEAFSSEIKASGSKIYIDHRIDIGITICFVSLEIDSSKVV